MKNFSRSLILALVLCVFVSSCACAAISKSIHGGMLAYLGTTEDEFQQATDQLHDLLKAYSFALNPAAVQEYVEVLIAMRDDRHVIHFYDNLTSMLMALNAGRVDEISLPEAVARYIMRKGEGYRVLFTIFMPSSISFGFRAEDTGLCEDFNKAIAAMKEDGTFKALEEKYIKNAEENPAAVEFSKIDGAGTITVAVTGDMPPIDYVDGSGKAAGYNTAVLAELGKRMNKNIALLNIEAGARSAALTSKRADVIFWYRNTQGITIPEETGFKGTNPINSVMKDSNEGVILSEPYYEWEKTLMLTK